MLNTHGYSNGLIVDKGNVGIGTTGPTHKLDMRGPLRIDQGSSNDIWIQGGSATSGTSRNLAILGIKSSDELRLNYNGEYTGGVRIQGSKTIIDGNVGIGTTSPGATLEVKGTMKIFGEWADMTAAAGGGAVQGPAPTDGFVCAHGTGGGTKPITGYTDHKNPPETIRCYGNYPYGGNPEGITMPIRKGHYWKVVNASTVYWIPFGN